MTALAAFLAAINSFVRVGMCESHMNPVATNGTHWGVWQFDDPTWHSTTGLSGHASDYSLLIQFEGAVKLQRERGWEPWTCRWVLG